MLSVPSIFNMFYPQICSETWHPAGMPYISLSFLTYSPTFVWAHKIQQFERHFYCEQIHYHQSICGNAILFLKDNSQVLLANKILDIFSKAFGRRLNIKKYELLAIKDGSIDSISNIPIKTVITYLGIKIVKNETQRCAVNFDSVIEKIKK